MKRILAALSVALGFVVVAGAATWGPGLVWVDVAAQVVQSPATPVSIRAKATPYPRVLARVEVTSTGSVLESVWISLSPKNKK